MFDGIIGTATETFEIFDKAIDRLNFDETRKLQLYRILAGIYALGKVKFQIADSGEGCILTHCSKKAIDFTSKLLSIDCERLSLVLTTRKIQPKGDIHNVISYVKYRLFRYLKIIYGYYLF